MRRKPRRKGERLIDFLKYRVGIFFDLIFCRGWIIETALTAIQFRAKAGNHPHEALLNSGLTLADSGFWLDLEIALYGVSAPNAFGVETSDDVIWEAFTIIVAICLALLYAPDGVS